MKFISELKLILRKEHSVAMLNPMELDEHLHDYQHKPQHEQIVESYLQT